MHTLIWVDRHDSRRGENIDCMFWFLGVYKLDIRALSLRAKVEFGRELPQENVAECLFRRILQDTIFFVKWRNLQLCM